MTTNAKHIDDNKRVTIRKVDGATVKGICRRNDILGRVLHVEVAEGDFETVSYDDFKSAAIHIVLNPKKKG